MGILTGGICAGNIISPILVGHLMEKFGLFGTCLIYGALMLNCCPASLVFHPVKWQKKKKEKNQSETLPKASLCLKIIKSIKTYGQEVIVYLKVLKYYRAVIISIGTASFMSGYINFIMLVPLKMKTEDFSLEESAWCISAAGISSMVLRLIITPLTDLPKFNMRICYLLGAVIVTVTSASKNLFFINIDIRRVSTK